MDSAPYLRVRNGRQLDIEMMISDNLSAKLCKNVNRRLIKNNRIIIKWNENGFEVVERDRDIRLSGQR